MNMINRRLARTAFESYVADYDSDNENIRLKIDHTYRVTDFCERIASSITDDDGTMELAWLLGLLHDIGRFEQIRRYNTFIDRNSVDHAELGADILFEDGLIGRFIGDEDRTLFPLIETAIRLHNKLVVPDGLDEKTLLFSNILRDADKCDIFRVLCEPPLDKRFDVIRQSTEPAGDVVMQCVLEHRCVPRTFDMTPFEALLAQCCMGFELVYDESRRIVKEQGYLDRLLSIEVKGALKEQMEIMRAQF